MAVAQELTVASTLTVSSAAAFQGAVSISSNLTMTGTINSAGTGGVPIQGTTTNTSAAAGYIGEYIEATTSSGSPVSMSDAATTTLVSQSIAAGNYDVWGTTVIESCGTNYTSFLITGISTQAATLPTLNAYRTRISPDVGVGPTILSVPVPQRQLNFSSSGTIYLVGFPAFVSGGANPGYGYIGIRRRV